MGHNKPSKLMRDGLIIPCPEQIYEDVITVKGKAARCQKMHKFQ